MSVFIPIPKKGNAKECSSESESEVAQSYPTLCDPMDCSLPGSSVHGIFQARGDGIPVELFQILKDDAVKVLHSICQHIWKIQQWPQDWKMSVFIPIPKKGNAKERSNYHTIAFISGQQSNAQNSPSQASTVHELRISRCSSCIQKRQRNQKSVHTRKTKKRCYEYM